MKEGIGYQSSVEHNLTTGADNRLEGVRLQWGTIEGRLNGGHIYLGPKGDLALSSGNLLRLLVILEEFRQQDWKVPSDYTGPSIVTRGAKE